MFHLFARVFCACCAVMLLASPAVGAEIIITSDTTLSDAGPSPSTDYSVRNGTLTLVDGAVARRIETDTHLSGEPRIIVEAGIVSLGIRIDDRSSAIINGGTINSFSTGLDSTLTINGGVFGSSANSQSVTFNRSTIEINGGLFHPFLRAQEGDTPGGVITITGGTFLGGADFEDHMNWTVNIHGGNWPNEPSFGEDNVVNLYGYHFEEWKEGDLYWMSGILADGQPFTDAATTDVFTAHIIGPMPGDTNGDFLVDLEDLNSVRNNFGGSGEGDTDKDGDVDLDDLNAVRNHFGFGQGVAHPPTTSVPEPATAVMAMVFFGLAGIPLRRRCRLSQCQSP